MELNEGLVEEMRENRFRRYELAPVDGIVKTVFMDGQGSLNLTVTVTKDTITLQGATAEGAGSNR